MRVKGPFLDNRGAKPAGGERPLPAVTDAGEAPSFAGEVQRIEARHWRERIDRLLMLIDRQAERIKEHQTVGEIQRYRDLVREFLREATQRVYQRREESRWDRRGKLRVMAVVAEVDQQLGELTRMVLQDQRDPLAILQKLGEIRGILVDLYL